MMMTFSTAFFARVAGSSRAALVGGVVTAIATAAGLLGGQPARAETAQVKVATQFGLAYLPLVVMEHDRLWERHAKARGVDLAVEYTRLGGGSALNDALLSDSADVVAGGLAPMLALWDKTRSSMHVRGLSAINASPMDILTNKPGVSKLGDLGPDDKIAVPAIRVSIQAIGLAAAAEREFGEGGGARLDNQTVAMQHPDALAALLSPRSPIAAYVSSSPFQERALKQEGVHKITDSFQAFGQAGTFAVAYVKGAFVENNPKIVAAYYDALQEAVEVIAKDKAAAVDAYVATTKDGTDRATLIEILDRPSFTFSSTPAGTAKFAAIMKKMGLLKGPADDWKAFFVEPLHAQPGS